MKERVESPPAPPSLPLHSPRLIVCRHFMFILSLRLDDDSGSLVVREKRWCVQSTRHVARLTDLSLFLNKVAASVTAQIH